MLDFVYEVVFFPNVLLLCCELGLEVCNLLVQFGLDCLELLWCFDQGLNLFLILLELILIVFEDHDHGCIFLLEFVSHAHVQLIVLLEILGG